MFIDLFNLSTFLIPRESIPPLTRDMKASLNMGWKKEVSVEEEEIAKNTNGGYENTNGIK